MNDRSRHDVSYFAETNFRNARQRFGMRQADRLQHMYVLGRTGSGKSTLLETLFLQDLYAGRGAALIDPHGHLYESIRSAILQNRECDLVDFDAPNAGRQIGFNPLAGVRPDQISLVASGIMEVLQTLWPSYWGPRMEHVLRNALLALLYQDTATLADILRLFRDSGYRRQVVETLPNPSVRDFWRLEYEKIPYRMRAEAVAPILNRVGAFLADPVLRAIVTNTEQAVDLRRLMDTGGILLVNLSKGRLGADASHLLGALLLSMLGTAALGRADMAPAARLPFHAFVDEFHSMITRSTACLLPECRKYCLSLTLAHQHLSQLELEIRDAILGNVGTMVCFRIGVVDARLIEQVFYPVSSRLNCRVYSLHFIPSVTGVEVPVDGRLRVVPMGAPCLCGRTNELQQQESARPSYA